MVPAAPHKGRLNFEVRKPESVATEKKMSSNNGNSNDNDNDDGKPGDKILNSYYESASGFKDFLVRPKDNPPGHA